MKTFFTLLLSLLLSQLTFAGLTIVSAEHYDADSFKRVSEYFTGKESEGRYHILRSDDTRRDGFYVSLLAEEKSDIKRVSKIRIQFVRPGTQDVEQREFTQLSLHKPRLLVGLTESEWLDTNSRPVAWKIDLIDSDDLTIESAKSFLWAD